MGSESATEFVDRVWRERGIAPAMLAEAHRLGISDSQLQRMLVWNAAEERFALEVRWAAQLASGKIRFRQLTTADDEALCELWANAPEEIGEFDVTAERGPAAFAQFEL